MRALDLQPGDTISGIRVDSVRHLGDDPVTSVIVTLDDTADTVAYQPDDEVDADR